MIKISNLSLRYNSSEKNILENVFFDVLDWEVVAVVWKSWIGKTSLLYAIWNIFNKNEVVLSGNIYFWIENPRIRIVFQDHNLLPYYNVYQNLFICLKQIWVTKKEANRRIKDILDLVWLLEFMYYLPDELSIWMQQRINLARAIICEPDILLLDEPFSSLDKNTKKGLYELFQKIQKEKNMTCILVAHDEKEVNILANRIYDLNLKRFINA